MGECDDEEAFSFLNIDLALLKLEIESDDAFRCVKLTRVLYCLLGLYEAFLIAS